MKLDKRPLIVGVGEILWDKLPSGKRLGGAPSNFVFHAATLGAAGYIISAVGNDIPGYEILDTLERLQLKHSIVSTPYPTGSVSVTLSAGVPSYIINESVAWDHIPLTQEASKVCAFADAVSYGTLASRCQTSRTTIETLLREACGGAFKFFDINLRGEYYSKELILGLLKYADCLKFNRDEFIILRKLYETDLGEDDFCGMLINEHDLRYVILTNGSEYSSVYSHDEKSCIMTPKVDVKDTVGAGDAFSGAFLYSVLTGSSMAEAHKKGVEAAGIACANPESALFYLYGEIPLDRNTPYD